MPPRKKADAVRTDSIDTAILGAVANMITGAGQSDDPTTGWAPALGGRELWPAELQKLSENGLGDLTVSLKPLWIWCAGLRVDLDGDLRPAPHRAAAIMARRDIGDEERADLLKGGKALLERHLLDLGARDAFRMAHKHARQMGGGGVLVRTWPQQRLDQPLDLDGRRVVALVPMSGYHLRVKEIGRNPFSSRYGLPIWYSIDHTGGSGEWWASDVHWSHVLDFYGVRRLVPELALCAWSQWPAVSSLQACWDALRGMYAAALNNEDAQRRMSVFVIKYPNFAAAMGGNKDAFIEFLQTISQKLGVRGTYNAPPGGDVDTASLSLSGMGEINDWFKQLYATYERVPYGLLWDAGGSGLSKDTLTWDAWTTTLTGEFSEAGYAAAYKRLIDYVAHDVYAAEPSILKIEPGDFRQPSDRERLELRQMGATEAAAAIAAGIAPPEAFEEARYRGTFQTDVRVQKGWREKVTPPAAPQPDPAVSADAPIDSPEDIPDDTSAEDFAAQMTALGFAACEHGKKNRCLICRIERVRQVEAGPDGQPRFAGGWRAIRTDADFSGTSYLWLPVPEIERVATVQRAVDEIVPLEGYAPGDPMPAVYHVTALYLGETSRARAREVQTRAPPAAGPVVLRPVRVGTFPAQDDGRSPVFIELESAEIAALNGRLRDALAPLPPPEHVPFVAHITLGFARVTTEIAADLASIPVPPDLGESAELRFTFDGRDTVWPL